MDTPRSKITVSVIHEEFLNSAFALWIGGQHFLDESCIPIRMHEVWRDLVLRQIIVKKLSILRKEVGTRRERVVPENHGMSDLILALKEAEINAEAIPSHIHQGYTETKKSEV